MTRRSGGIITRRAAMRRPPSDEPWIWLPQSLLESNSVKSLSINAHRVLLRLLLEHLGHAALENGELRVSYRQFEDWGVSRNCIAAAIRELECKGLIDRRCGHADGNIRPPILYELTFYATERHGGATNRWRRYRGGKPSKTVGPSQKKPIAHPQTEDTSTPVSESMSHLGYPTESGP